MTPVGTYTGFDVFCDMDSGDGGWLVRNIFCQFYWRVIYKCVYGQQRYLMFCEAEDSTVFSYQITLYA